MQSRNRYILYKKLNPSPIYMLLGISDRAKLGVGVKCKKNKCKMQECTPGNATCCAESWINPQSTCCSTSAGAERIEQKRGRWEMQMRGQKANVSRCRIDVLNFRLLESAFDLFLANVWFYYQLAELLCLQYQLCHFTEIKDFLITGSKGLDFAQFWLKPFESVWDGWKIAQRLRESFC